jgi:hypothetical protein
MLGNYFKNNNAFLRRNTHYGKESFTWLRAGCDFINTHYPFCWDVLGDNAYALAGGDDFGVSFGVFKVPINFKDSLTYVQQEEAFHDSLKQVYKTEKEYKEYIYNVYWRKLSQKRNSRTVTQLSELPRVLQGRYKDYPLKPGAISFDMIVLDSANIEFYIRDMKQLTRWHYKYPPTYLDHEESDAWKEIITYSSDTLGSYPYLEENLWIMNLEDGWQNHPKADRVLKKWKQVEEPYCNNPYLPSGRKHKYKAISDSSFFQGHFKAIKQSEQRYLVNTLHGAIYILTPEKIVMIGQIKMDDYFLLNEEKIFIEDRDHNRLIFFAPVEWENTNLPKPNVYYMKEDEMREYFKYVMD